MKVMSGQWHHVRVGSVLLVILNIVRDRLGGRSSWRYLGSREPQALSRRSCDSRDSGPPPQDYSIDRPAGTPRSCPSASPPPPILFDGPAAASPGGGRRRRGTCCRGRRVGESRHAAGRQGRRLRGAAARVEGAGACGGHRSGGGRRRHREPSAPARSP